MANRLLKVKFRGEINSDKSKDDIESTVSTAVNLVEQDPAQTLIDTGGVGEVYIEVLVNGASVSLDEAITLFTNMISSDFTINSAEASFDIQ